MLAAAFAVAALTTTMSIQPTHAQLSKDPGASFFTPGQSQEQTFDKGGASTVSPGSTLDSPAGAPEGGGVAGSWKPDGSTAIPGTEGIIGGVIGGGPFAP